MSNTGRIAIDDNAVIRKFNRREYIVIRFNRVLGSVPSIRYFSDKPSDNMHKGKKLNGLILISYFFRFSSIFSKTRSNTSRSSWGMPSRIRL